MKFRTGVVVGFGLGFYAGSAAGRQKFEQINQTLRKAKESGPAQAVSTKAAEATQAARDAAAEKVQSATDQVTSSS
jgi:hypothetical protein